MTEKVKKGKEPLRFLYQWLWELVELYLYKFRIISKTKSSIMLTCHLKLPIIKIGDKLWKTYMRN